MIWDAFTYFNEAELLEIRLNELYTVVDRFVICESAYTHAGNPKELNFDINRYPEFRDKITYIVDENPPNKNQIDVNGHAFGQAGGPAWANENHQRDYLNTALNGLGVDDLIIVSDLDEIPSAEGVRQARDLIEGNKISDFVVVFEHKTYYYMLNYWALDYVGSKIMSGRKFKSKMKNSPQRVREYWSGTDVFTIPSWWHFGWLGGTDRVRYKFKEFAHQEYTREGKVEGVVNNISNMVDMWGRKLHKVPLDSTFPKFLVKYQERFSNLIDRT